MPLPGLHNRGNAGNMFPAALHFLQLHLAGWAEDPASQLYLFSLEASQMTGRQQNVCQTT